MTKKIDIYQCPCGQIPETFSIDENGQGLKYLQATPTCCSDWSFEFRNNEYHEPDSNNALILAIEAWNEMPRWWG